MDVASIVSGRFLTPVKRPDVVSAVVVQLKPRELAVRRLLPLRGAMVLKQKLRPVGGRLTLDEVGKRLLEPKGGLIDGCQAIGSLSEGGWNVPGSPLHGGQVSQLPRRDPSVLPGHFIKAIVESVLYQPGEFLVSVDCTQQTAKCWTRVGP
jgi:hypothetical protein